MSDGASTAAMGAAPTSTAAIGAAPTSTTAIGAAVVEAVSAVCDPEYPEITIAQLGILERVWVSDDASAVRVELVPTMLGCPALDVIATDVAAAARRACLHSRVPAEAPAQGVPPDAPAQEVSVEVVFVADPVWTPDRIAADAADFMAREYSVAVRRTRSEVVCPVCGNDALEHRTDFGPTPCRSVEWCPSCRNPVEVLGRAGLPVTA